MAERGNKNKTSESIAGTMSGFGFAVGGSGYDKEDRLVNWQRDDTNLDQSWNLSLVGDWNSITENSTTQNRTHNAVHELLSVSFPLPLGEGQGEGTVEHDAKGNITLLPSSLRPTASSLTWDFDNRLASADVDNDSTPDVFYQFDALGRRIGRDDGTDHTIYVQNGQQTFADYPAGTAASSPTYTYVFASFIDEPVRRGGSGGARYFHRNGQYSVIAITNGSASIQERYAYTAYGAPTITDASGTPRTATAEGKQVASSPVDATQPWYPTPPRG